MQREQIFKSNLNQVDMQCLKMKSQITAMQMISFIIIRNNKIFSFFEWFPDMMFSFMLGFIQCFEFHLHAVFFTFML